MAQSEVVVGVFFSFFLLKISARNAFHSAAIRLSTSCNDAIKTRRPIKWPNKNWLRADKKMYRLASSPQNERDATNVCSVMHNSISF